MDLNMRMTHRRGPSLMELAHLHSECCQRQFDEYFCEGACLLQATVYLAWPMACVWLCMATLCPSGMTSGGHQDDASREACGVPWHMTCSWRCCMCISWRLHVRCKRTCKLSAAGNHEHIDQPGDVVSTRMHMP